MIVAVCLELDRKEWLGNAIPVPPTDGQAAAGLIIRRAAGPNNAANATRAIMGAS
jgi:hypothetical protein